MKYRYAYKSSDGVRHEADIEASSRDEAFASLRAQGIRPIKVLASDGSKANGEIRFMGIPRRIFYGSILSVAILAAGGTWMLRGSRKPAPPIVITKVETKFEPSLETQSLKRQAMPLPRQEIHGSRRRIEIAPTNLFDTGLDTYLSAFAEPGRIADVKKTKPLFANPEELSSILDRPIHFTSDEYTEYIDLKRITAGIKQEMKEYLAGGGSSEEFFSALQERQNLEVAHREKALHRLNDLVGSCPEPAKAYDFWLKANAQLQSMGIYPLPLPDALRDYQSNLNLDE